MSGDDYRLLIEPVVEWPRHAETESDYLVTVDLRGPLPVVDGEPPSWPYPDEEFTFSVTLDGSPHFVCTALNEPSVVLHRFGGTYGEARFRVSTGSDAGPAALWLTVMNQWGVPVRKAELRSEIQERDSGAARRMRQVEVLRDPPPALSPGPAPQVPEHWGREPEIREQPSDPDPEVRQQLRNRTPAPAGRQTVTVSFAGFNRAWAAWIAYCLERRGRRVAFQRWDPSADVPLSDLLRDLLLGPGPVLLVLSEWYFQLGRRTEDEWDTALREVVDLEEDRFAAVMVTMGQLPTAASLLRPVELHGVGQEEAERRVLQRLGMPTGSLPPESPDSSHRAPRFPAATPEVWGGVPRRNTRFTGRERLLNETWQLLQDAGQGAGVIALFGMSGVGKTQLAAEYVYRFGSEYDVVWWVDAATRVTYRRRLAELAPQLGLSTGAEYGERLRAVRDSLRRGDPYERWLVILDGADEPDQIWDLVPNGPGHVLITSRNADWSEHNSRLLEVPVYDRDESVAFIRRRAPRLTDTGADQLAEALEDLPLLLDQTAGWLNDTDLSVEEYVALLEGGLDESVVRISDDFPMAFETAWSILLNKLRDTVPESVELLRLCTFFAPGFTPVRLLKEMPYDGLPPTLAGVLRDPLLWNKAINQLRQYSVVRLESHESDGDEASFGESLYLHRMVHQIVHRDMPGHVRREYADVARRALAAADPGQPTDTRAWRGYAEIVPHLTYADVLQSKDPAVQTLVFNCLRYMYFSGEYDAGVSLGRRALDAWRRLLTENDPEIWELTHHYANLLRAVGDYQRTEALSRSAVTHLEAEHGAQDLVTLRAASGLAADLRGLARYDEALELSRRLVEAYRELLGEQHSRTLSAQNNWGVSLRLLGRYEEALDIDRRTMEERRVLLRGRHPWTLSSELSFATDLRLLGRYAEADSVQVRNVREHGVVMGPESPQALQAEHNLALCHSCRGDRATAGVLLARVLERGERVLGETHPLTLIFTGSMGCFAREHGDIDQARELGESVVARYEVMLAEGHPYIAGVRANHALVLRSVGERDHAHVLIEQSLADMTAAVGEAHPWTLGCAINAAALRNLVGDPEGAAALSQIAVTQAGETLGRTHPLTLSARIALAADLRALRDRQQAEKIEQEALADLAATLGDQHVHTISARSRNRPYWDFEPQST
ncbi:FxSxx-COOH system tetratricopeptide repeat protein [Streptomyces krungchingensis]|uniref:FxSxx-COOH system tetratricopeptide repeat protein n=1 Tax=Streptomyces krungchingensis TaxID=1565034 RepID=UPI003CF2E89A